MASFQPIEVWSPTNFSYRCFQTSATTTSGVATFYLTDDGTTNGNALFTTITNLQTTPEANTSSAIASPCASIKSISGDKKTVTVNVTTGVNMIVLGSTLAFAPNGTTVYLLAIGYVSA